MENLQTILLVLQVLMAISLIGLILVQHGKGADAGAAFGSGSSNTVFGSQGSGNFLTKMTAVLAFLFLVNSLSLAYIANQRIRTSTSIMDAPTSINQPGQEERSPVINEIPTEPESGVPGIPE
ncbi:MAG: preprotein translocase subunit SecG [Gammaproteobacteria bacterium]